MSYRVTAKAKEYARKRAAKEAKRLAGPAPAYTETPRLQGFFAKTSSGVAQDIRAASS